MYYVARNGLLKLLGAAEMLEEYELLGKVKLPKGVTLFQVHQWVYLVYTRATGAYGVLFSNLGEYERKARIVDTLGSKLFKSVEEAENVERVEAVKKWIALYKRVQFTRVDGERELMLNKLSNLNEALMTIDYGDADDIKREALLLSNKRQLEVMLSELDTKRSQELSASEHLLGAIALFERPDAQMPNQMRALIAEAELQEKKDDEARALGFLSSI